jgi:hypothetical protein
MNSSPFWQDREQALELFRKCIISRIGSGSKVRIWRNNWITWEISLYHWLVRIDQELHLVNLQMKRDVKECDEGVVRRAFFIHDASELLKIHLSPRQEEGSLCASHHKRTTLFLVQSV